MEPRVRRLVATHLGVDPGSLQPDTDLRLGPAAMRSLARALERSFSVVLGEPDLARLRSCRDLSALVTRRVAERHWPAGPNPPVWVRVVPANPDLPSLERLVELDPYMVQTIVEDARCPGSSRKLELILGPGQSVQSATQVERLLAAARAAGLSVRIVQSGASSSAAPPVGRRRSRS
jgi:hypothetical protein